VAVTTDFGLTDFVFQNTGPELTWDITWQGVLNDSRFVAVSFQSEYGGSQLVRVSEWFSTDPGGTQHVFETIVASESLGTDFVAIRFAVAVIFAD
jgi:hypothetical protein